MSRSGHGAQRLLVVVTVVVLGWLNMPALFYRGDAHAIRAGATHFINHGTFGIPYAKQEQIDEIFRAQRGQYFFFNDDQQRLYSKYRVANSLVFAPPLLVHRILHGPVPFFSLSRSRVFGMNVYNILTSAVIALYLLALAHRYTQRALVALTWTFATLYGTFLWYYLRAQTAEIFQVCLSLGFFFHLLRHADQRRAAEPAARQLCLAMAHGALLTLMKPYYGLLFPCAWGALQLARTGTAAVRLRSAARDGLTIGGAALIAAGLVLLENASVFGGPFVFGYGQALSEGGQADYFDPGILPTALKGFFWDGNRNVFLHHPLIVLGAFGIPFFWREHRTDLLQFGVCLIVFTLFIASYSFWAGHWCYGPRYLLFVLVPVGALSIPALDWIAERAGSMRVVAATALALGIGFSTYQQVQVNRLDFHANYLAERYFAGIEDRRIADYFGSHEALIFGDLHAFKHRKAPFPPLVFAQEIVGARGLEQIASGIRGSGALRTNYWFFPDRPRRGSP